MFKFTNRVLFQLLSLQPINHVLYDGTYEASYIDRTTGKRKVFWCCTWQDAIEWVDLLATMINLL